MDPSDKVRDKDHYTGDYQGPAHSEQAIAENSKHYIVASVVVMVGSYQDRQGVDRPVKVKLVILDRFRISLS